MEKVFLFLAILLSVNCVQAYAQSPLNPFVVEDDTLPIANSRFDDAVEVPQDNFSSAGKNDTWEKFERGELGAKAYVDLQRDYNAKTKGKTAKNGRPGQIKRDVASPTKKSKKAPRKPQGVPTKLPKKKFHK